MKLDKILWDIVAIKVDPVENKTASGLLLAEEWKTLPQTGTVIGVGPEVTEIKAGDRIAFNRYASIIFDKETRLVTERNCHATVK